MAILSDAAKQFLRVALQSVELADEFSLAITVFSEGFLTFDFSSNSSDFVVAKSVDIPENSVLTLSVLVAGKDFANSSRASFGRTRMFYRVGTQPAEMQGNTQTDFTEKSSSDFDIQLSVEDNKAVIKVRNSSGIDTKWNGSVILSKAT